MASVDSFARSQPTSSPVGVSDAGASAPTAMVVPVSWTWNETPIASWGLPGASVTNTAFQSPAAAKSTVAT